MSLRLSKRKPRRTLASLFNMQRCSREGIVKTSEWFASWFDSVHYHKLYAYRDDAEAARFLDELVSRLHARGSARVLDLGCGAGRHAKYLASKNLRVVGMDLASGSIREAKKSERPGLRFLQHDMRVPFGRGAFDYVFNFFTSFGYFEQPGEHLAVVRNMATSLREGGALVLDYLNVRYAETRLTAEEVKEIDGVTYRLTRWTNAHAFFKRIVVDDGVGRPLEYVERVAKFTLQDFERMFALHDLNMQEVHGDYCLSPYDAVISPRMILVATSALPRSLARTASIPDPRSIPSVIIKEVHCGEITSVAIQRGASHRHRCRGASKPRSSRGRVADH
jgi:SAM-dependent methyltransferase